MKPLGAGGAAALIGLSAVAVAGAVPAAADAPAPPSVRATCAIVEFTVSGSYSGTGYRVAAGTGFAENGEPELIPDDRYLDGGSFVLDRSRAYRWHVQLWAPDGSVVWDQSGTTTPCAPAILGQAQPVLPPVPPCGSTLDDVAWPSTPGVTYSHDAWYGYAHLQPGWVWVHAVFGPPNGWWIKGDTIESSLAYLPREVLLDPTGHCGITSEAPPVGSVANGPSPSRQSSSKAGAQKPAATLAAQPNASPVPPAPQPSMEPASTPSANPSPTAAPTPSTAPSPSPTPGAGAAPRVATATGLAVAGGTAGAVVLTATGAFVARRLLHPTQGVPGPDGTSSDLDEAADAA